MTYDYTSTCLFHGQHLISLLFNVKSVVHSKVKIFFGQQCTNHFHYTANMRISFIRITLNFILNVNKMGMVEMDFKRQTFQKNYVYINYGINVITFDRKRQNLNTIK